MDLVWIFCFRSVNASKNWLWQEDTSPLQIKLKRLLKKLAQQKSILGKKINAKIQKSIHGPTSYSVLNMKKMWKPMLIKSLKKDHNVCIMRIVLQERVQVWWFCAFSRLSYCSPDPKTNSETINLNFFESLICFVFVSSKQHDWLNNFWKFSIFVSELVAGSSEQYIF